MDTCVLHNGTYGGKYWLGLKKQTRDSYTWSTRDFRDRGEKSHEKLSTSGSRNSFNLKGGKGATKRDKEWVK